MGLKGVVFLFWQVLWECFADDVEREVVRLGLWVVFLLARFGNLWDLVESQGNNKKKKERKRIDCSWRDVS